jgi:hypothetical protein
LLLPLSMVSRQPQNKKGTPSFALNVLFWTIILITKTWKTVWTGINGDFGNFSKFKIQKSQSSSSMVWLSAFFWHDYESDLVSLQCLFTKLFHGMASHEFYSAVGEQKWGNASFSKFPQALSELNLTVYFLYDFPGIASLSGSSMRIFWNPSISMIWMKSRKSNSEVIFWNSWILNISYLAPSHGNSRSLKI